MVNNIFRAFTTKYNGLATSLRNTVAVKTDNTSIGALALWDTGATRSCVSHDIVNKLSLVPIGKASIRTPSGASIVDTYMVDVVLPNDVLVKDIIICDSDIGTQGLGILIGMDIIKMGDFAVSNFDGKTTFSFRLPSKFVTDYAKQIIAENTIGPKHGRGKRKRK